MNTPVKTQRRKIASRMKEARLERGLSQGHLAKAAGIDRKTINRIENNHFSPSLDTFMRFCRAIDVTPASLLKGVR